MYKSNDNPNPTVQQGPHAPQHCYCPSPQRLFILKIFLTVSSLVVYRYVGVGIGEIGNGKGFSAYRPDFVGKVGNFTDSFSTLHIVKLLEDAALLCPTLTADTQEDTQTTE
jgi:hypothetical protein